MSFTLEEAKLWDHVLGTAISPPLVQSKTDDNEERAESIHQRFLKVKEFSDDTRWTVVKVGRMCTETVEKGFSALKSLTTWTPKELWEHLQTPVYPSELGIRIKHPRQAAPTRLQEMSQSFSRKSEMSPSEISDLNNHDRIIHTLNSLDTQLKPLSGDFQSWRQREGHSQKSYSKALRRRGATPGQTKTQGHC